MKQLQIAPTPPAAPHPPSSRKGEIELAVRLFGDRMARTLFQKFDEGRDGWTEDTSDMRANLKLQLAEAVKKGNPVHIANYCMMLWHHGVENVNVDWKDHVPEDQRGGLIAEYDDGSAVLHSSASGGAHPAGAWVQTTLMQVKADGTVTFWDYVRSGVRSKCMDDVL